jgi:hypothetical protein
MLTGLPYQPVEEKRILPNPMNPTPMLTYRPAPRSVYSWTEALAHLDFVSLDVESKAVFQHKVMPDHCHSGCLCPRIEASGFSRKPISAN